MDFDFRFNLLFKSNKNNYLIEISKQLCRVCVITKRYLLFSSAHELNGQLKSVEKVKISFDPNTAQI